MVRSCQTNEAAILRRVPHPVDSRRSVAECNPFDGSIVANPKQPADTSRPSDTQNSCSDLESGCQSHANGAQSEGKSPDDDDSVDALGKRPGDATPAIRPQKPAGTDSRGLRPAELTRLLNSTPLGRVISERQLYRHRQRAGPWIHAGRRIHFGRYLAWLIHEADARKKKRPLVGYVTVTEGSRMRLRETETESRGDVTAHEVLQLLLHQNYRCALSGRDLAPEQAALDHIVPISCDGEHSIENAQILHKDVNRAKGGLTNEEFIQLCREVAAHSDRSEANHED